MSLPFVPGHQNFVLYVENTLGTALDTSKNPRWKVLSMQAGRLRKKMETDPKLYSWQNLALTVEWLRHRHQRVATATGVCFQVEAALKDSGNARQLEPAIDVAVAIEKAIAWEQTRGLAGDPSWVSRLSRARGAGRLETYVEWKAARLE